MNLLINFVIEHYVLIIFITILLLILISLKFTDIAVFFGELLILIIEIFTDI